MRLENYIQYCNFTFEKTTFIIDIQKISTLKLSCFAGKVIKVENHLSIILASLIYGNSF